MNKPTTGRTLQKETEISRRKEKKCWIKKKSLSESEDTYSGKHCQQKKDQWWRTRSSKYYFKASLKKR